MVKLYSASPPHVKLDMMTLRVKDNERVFYKATPLTKQGWWVYEFKDCDVTLPEAHISWTVVYPGSSCVRSYPLSDAKPHHEKKEKRIIVRKESEDAPTVVVDLNRLRDSMAALARAFEFLSDGAVQRFMQLELD